MAAAGYERLDPSTVMTAALGAAQDDRRVRIEPGATPAWLNGIAAAQGVAPSHRLVHDRIVQAIALPAAFATAYVGAQAAGFGLGVGERGAVGLFDIVVRPEFRGQGLGRAITRALMAWGRDGGAETAYLQVNDANRVARGSLRDPRLPRRLSLSLPPPRAHIGAGAASMMRSRARSRPP